VSAGLLPVSKTKNSNLQTRGKLNLKSVVKFGENYLVPSSATLKVGQTQVFTPYSRVVQIDFASCPLPAPDDDLTPLCSKTVTKSYPYTNDKNDFVRLWTVNDILKGNSSVGKITPNNPSGATFTAPDQSPSPNTVKVGFISYPTELTQLVILKANVKIINENPDWLTTYFKPITINENPPPGQYSYTATMNELRFVFGSRSDDKTLFYDPQGSFTITSQSGPEDGGGCTTRLEPGSITVPLTNDDRGYLTITDPNDPSLSTTPGNYEAIVFGYWTASVIRDGAKCQGKYRNDNVSFGMYFLMTGTAGVGKVTPKISVLSGQNIHSEPGQPDFTWAWSMTSQEPKN
jgi:hypothetical protein